MKTTNQCKTQKKESNQLDQLENNRLPVDQMLLIKGGDVNDTEDNSGGSDDQEDGFN